jgi:hypothetical protein
MGDDAEFQMEFEKYGPWWEDLEGERTRSLTAVPFYFTPEEALEWDSEHDNRAGFVEAVVAAHYVRRGYHVLRDFCTTDREVAPKDGLKWHSTQLLHDVIGSAVSQYLCSQLASRNRLGYGEPDLFVFREAHPNDPKLHFLDPRLWFFVEIKGPRDKVRDNQLAFWSDLADGTGDNRLVLARVAPVGTRPRLETVEY